MNRLLALLVVLVLAATCWVAYQEFAEPDEGSDAPAETSPGEPSYSDLEVFDDAGRFGGSIAIHNPLNRDAEILVEIDIYNGDQNVGDLFGSVSLKPDSASRVELQGFDDFVEYTDIRVHLTGWPK